MDESHFNVGIGTQSWRRFIILIKEIRIWGNDEEEGRCWTINITIASNLSFSHGGVKGKWNNEIPLSRLISSKLYRHMVKTFPTKRFLSFSLASFFSKHFFVLYCQNLSSGDECTIDVYLGRRWWRWWRWWRLWRWGEGIWLHAEAFTCKFAVAIILKMNETISFDIRSVDWTCKNRARL